MSVNILRLKSTQRMAELLQRQAELLQRQAERKAERVRRSEEVQQRQPEQRRRAEEFQQRKAEQKERLQRQTERHAKEEQEREQQEKELLAKEQQERQQRQTELRAKEQHERDQQEKERTRMGATTYRIKVIHKTLSQSSSNSELLRSSRHLGPEELILYSPEVRILYSQLREEEQYRFCQTRHAKEKCQLSQHNLLEEETLFTVIDKLDEEIQRLKGSKRTSSILEKGLQKKQIERTEHIQYIAQKQRERALAIQRHEQEKKERELHQKRQQELLKQYTGNKELLDMIIAQVKSEMMQGFADMSSQMEASTDFIASRIPE